MEGVLARPGHPKSATRRPFPGRRPRRCVAIIVPGKVGLHPLRFARDDG